MTENNLTGKIKALIVDALEVPPESVSEDLTFGDLPQWDSLGHMEVMMRLEEQFGIEINTDTIAALVSIPEICAYIKSRNNV